jgi:hypothetical protein
VQSKPDLSFSFPPSLLLSLPSPFFLCSFHTFILFSLSFLPLLFPFYDELLLLTCMKWEPTWLTHFLCYWDERKLEKHSQVDLEA